jgi:hypothetical protein
VTKQRHTLSGEKIMSTWNKERKCLNCGAVFSWRDRYDKQYCNAKCRKQAERKRKAIDCLNQLRGQIDYELRELKDPNEIQRKEMLAEYRRQRDL